MIDPTYLIDVAHSGNDSDKMKALIAASKYISQCHEVMMKHIGPSYISKLDSSPELQSGKQKLIEGIQ
jgi:cytochrome c551/c552